MLRVASIIPCLNETDYLGAVLTSLHTAGISRNLVVCNKVGYRGTAQEQGATRDVAGHYLGEYIEGDFGNEARTRNAFLQALQNEGYDYALIVDADEIHDPCQLQALLSEVDKIPGKVPAFRTSNMLTYYKYPSYQIMPPERLAPVIMLRTDVRFVSVREIGLGISTMVLKDYSLYHFSYARPDAKIREKIDNFEHKDEVVGGWFESKFVSWSPEMRNLHPTIPEAYAQAIFQPPPEDIRKILAAAGSQWVRDHICTRLEVS